MIKTFKLWIIFFLSCATVFSSNSGLGPSVPVRLAVYHPAQWSSRGSWSPEGIPVGARITGVCVSWTTFGQNYQGLHFRLANQSGRETSVTNGRISHYFDGQNAGQNWSARYYVEWLQYPGRFFYVLPTLHIYWQSP